jgi:hypothetical protein
MSGRTITVRMPRAWVGVDSELVRRWLADFLRHPTPNLPPDPGGGDTRKSFSLPKRAVKVVSGLLDETESAALRRIIAARMNALPPASYSHLLPTMRGSKLLPPTAPLPRTLVSSPPTPALALSSWIPARSLERSSVPLARARVATQSIAAAKGPSALEVVAWLGLIALAVWILARLFWDGPKGEVVSPAVSSLSGMKSTFL